MPGPEPRLQGGGSLASPAPAGMVSLAHGLCQLTEEPGCEPGWWGGDTLYTWEGSCGRLSPR